MSDTIKKVLANWIPVSQPTALGDPDLKSYPWSIVTESDRTVEIVFHDTPHTSTKLLKGHYFAIAELFSARTTIDEIKKTIWAIQYAERSSDKQDFVIVDRARFERLLTLATAAACEWGSPLNVEISDVIDTGDAVLALQPGDLDPID